MWCYRGEFPRAGFAYTRFGEEGRKGSTWVAARVGGVEAGALAPFYVGAGVARVAPSPSP
jgi:hypothetical protein